MPFYHYKGSVTQFGKEIAYNWEGQTFAETERKALNNLSFQYKIQHNLAKTAKISLASKNLSIAGKEK